MRITKIDGHEWPITITCPNYPEVNIEISLPTDLKIIRQYKHEIVEDTPISTFINESIVCECPICGNLHTVSKDEIPPIILKRIPVSRV